MARIAHSLATLREQVNTSYPRRSKRTDGWIGDAKHRARRSDHNPNQAGVVTALDLTHDPAGGFDAHAFAERLRQAKDPRIKYVISRNRIFYGPSGKHPWVWQKYTRVPHNGHIHISAATPSSLHDSRAMWALAMTRPMQVGIASVPEAPPDPIEADVEEQANTTDPLDEGQAVEVEEPEAPAAEQL